MAARALMFPAGCLLLLLLAGVASAAMPAPSFCTSCATVPAACSTGPCAFLGGDDLTRCAGLYPTKVPKKVCLQAPGPNPGLPTGIRSDWGDNTVESTAQCQGYYIFWCYEGAGCLDPIALRAGAQGAVVLGTGSLGPAQRGFCLPANAVNPTIYDDGTVQYTQTVNGVTTLVTRQLRRGYADNACSPYLV